MFEAVAGFLIKMLSAPFVDKVIGYLEKKQDTQLEQDKLQTQITIEYIKSVVEDQKINADLQKTKMSYKWFWVFLSFALAPMLFKWTMINLYDVLWCKDCIYAQAWTIAAYQAPFDEWAKTAFTWILGPMAGGAGLGLGLTLGRK